MKKEDEIEEMKNYLILYLTTALIFVSVAWYYNVQSYERLEKKIVSDCTWFDFLGLIPEYCEKYIYKGK
jgi:hypothetical protein